MTTSPLLFSSPALCALGFPLSRAPVGVPVRLWCSPLGGALGASPLRVRWRPVGRWRSGGAVSAPPRANKPAGAGCFYCGSVKWLCKGQDRVPKAPLHNRFTCTCALCPPLIRSRKLRKTISILRNYYTIKKIHHCGVVIARCGVFPFYTQHL